MPVHTEPQWKTPTTDSKTGVYERVLQPLIERPGEWAEIGVYKNQRSAYQAMLSLRKGRYRIPDSPEQWEFANDGRAVYARYTNGGSPG